MDELTNWIWRMGTGVRGVGKKLGVSGPLEFAMMRAGVRLMPPPRVESEVVVGSGIRLCLPPNFLSYRSYLTGVYEQEVLALIPQMVMPGATVVDIGANVGLYTMTMSRAVGSSGRVYAFEPELAAFRYLKRNVARNGCANVVCINKAVSDHTGLVRFTSDHLERGFVSSCGDAPGEVVEATSLDDFFASEGWPTVAFVKLDIEGGERAALTGMRELCRRSRGMRFVMEYNQRAIQRAGESEERLGQILNELGVYKGRWIERDLEPFEIGAALPKSRTMYNALLECEPSRTA